ncbi:MAG: fibronectin type III domain-containing protein [Clostridia bacterium]|nr:fibronectin type III domain-containing protein [Clostridia bacterium]
MKRFWSVLLAAVMLVSLGTALAEGGGIDPVRSDADYKQRYEEMKGYFEDGDYEAAWEVAQVVYGTNPNYEDIFLYYSYLNARLVLIPAGRYTEAYYALDLLAGRKFADSEGYAHFAMGLYYHDQGDAENTYTWMVKAFNAGINEAAPYITPMPVSVKSITLTLKSAAETALSVSWTDSNGAGPYRVTCVPVGMSTPVRDETTEAMTASFRDLLPDTEYTVTVAKASAPSNAATEVYSTGKAATVDSARAHSVKIELYQVDRASVKSFNTNGVANTINSMKNKYVVLSADGYTRGNRKPSDSRDDFYLRINFAGDDKLASDTTARFTYVFRSNTDPMVSVGKTESVTLEKGWKTHSFYSDCLTDLMDLMHENGAFSGSSFMVEVYMDNQYIGSQEFAVSQR